MSDNSNPFKKIIILAIIVLLLAVLTLSYLSKIKNLSSPDSSLSNSTADSRLQKFTSEAELKAYLEKSSQPATSFSTRLNTPQIAPSAKNAPNIGSADTFAGGAAAERVSDTNVQVIGIDEADILKTDGQNLYYSPDRLFYRQTPPILPQNGVAPGISSKMIPPPQSQPQTNIIKAFPPADLQKLAQIDLNGQLLLSKQTLVVLGAQKIAGYSLSDPSSPLQTWEYTLEDNSQVFQSRLLGDKLYLVLRQNLNYSNPCPLKPLTSLTIACTDIYHPISDSQVDVVYTVLLLDPQNGTVLNKLSFLGSYTNSVVYMSPQALYITNSLPADQVGFIVKFFTQKGTDLISSSALERLKKLETYDLSSQAKMVELSAILQEFQRDLSADDRVRTENELNNRLKDFLSANRRQLEKTAINKISLANFTITATGLVPGHPLNQFSLDEHNNNLRIATTISDRTFGLQDSVNDVYVLDKNLQEIGSLKDLGQTEQIYSVRFLEDRGYLVTFRQTDPFYVLDLSNPQNPAKKGELKIPGFSSYLHPLAKNLILGIGRENSQLKVSLFDVSDPQSPAEIDKYLLKDYSSDILQTHLAFLQDPKHSIFFVPGSQDGYIFSYQDNKLQMVKAVADIAPRRAVYLNDYLYIVGDNKITILNEADWAEVNQLDL